MSTYPFFESVLIADIHQVAAVYGVRLALAPVQFVGAIREANPVSDTVVVGDDTSSIVVDISVADKFAAPLRTLVRVCGHVVIAVRSLLCEISMKDGHCRQSQLKPYMRVA